MTQVALAAREPGRGEVPCDPLEWRAVHHLDVRRGTHLAVVAGQQVVGDDVPRVEEVVEVSRTVPTYADDVRWQRRARAVDAPHPMQMRPAATELLGDRTWA